ncbi:hypothetical protein EDP1_301 [Pseudomonas putida S610]|nr:hypothetical protein EDP1_301 [Pseudomonas putida S610]
MKKPRKCGAFLFQSTRRTKKQVLHSASHCFFSALYMPSPKHPQFESVRDPFAI